MTTRLYDIHAMIWVHRPSGPAITPSQRHPRRVKQQYSLFTRDSRIAQKEDDYEKEEEEIEQKNDNKINDKSNNDKRGMGWWRREQQLSRVRIIIFGGRNLQLQESSCSKVEEVQTPEPGKMGFPPPPPSHSIPSLKSRLPLTHGIWVHEVLSGVSYTS